MSHDCSGSTLTKIRMSPLNKYAGSLGEKNQWLDKTLARWQNKKREDINHQHQDWNQGCNTVLCHLKDSKAMLKTTL